MTGRYAFSNAWELARRRLDLLEICHDPSSIRQAELLGVPRPGWRCLDAGAGGGSFARWLASQGASVVAADLDVTLLEEVDEPGLEVRQMDLTADPLEEAAFDFVHTRLLLIHVPSRDELLARLARALKPGGMLMVEEDDIYPILSTATGDYRDGWDAFLGATDRAGVDPVWARGLPGQLDRLGLSDVGADVDTQLFRGGSDAAQFWSLTWHQVSDRAPGDGIERGRDALEDETRWYYGPAKVIAWGRRPSG